MKYSVEIYKHTLLVQLSTCYFKILNKQYWRQMHVPNNIVATSMRLRISLTLSLTNARKWLSSTSPLITLKKIALNHQTCQFRGTALPCELLRYFVSINQTFYLIFKKKNIVVLLLFYKKSWLHYRKTSN